MFSTFLDNFEFQSQEAVFSNRSMQFEIKQNQFVSFKDQSKRTLLIKKKLPTSTYSNVRIYCE